MVSHDFIDFSDDKPSIEQIIHQLSINTGLEIFYDYEKTDLWSRQLDRSIGLYDGDNNNYFITVFDIDDLKIKYLVDSTIWVLVQLGGEYDAQLPKWAGLKWELAKFMI